jgi:hypothetical protein
MPDDKTGQATLFDVGEWWHEHWKGMPEFVQKNLEPYKTISVHFETREDMEAFAALVGQRVAFETRSIWFPEAEIGRYVDKKYADEPPAFDETESDDEILGEG